MAREEWDGVRATKVTGAFLHFREAVKAMIPNRSAAIVNIASYASFEDGRGFLADHGTNAPIGRAARPQESPRSSPSSPPTAPASSSARSSWPTAA